jgi:hypothetical protein
MVWGRQKHARDVFGRFFVDRPADAALTYEWANTLLEVKHIWYKVHAQIDKCYIL